MIYIEHTMSFNNRELDLLEKHGPPFEIDRGSDERVDGPGGRSVSPTGGKKKNWTLIVIISAASIVAFLIIIALIVRYTGGLSSSSVESTSESSDPPPPSQCGEMIELFPNWHTVFGALSPGYYGLPGLNIVGYTACGISPSDGTGQYGKYYYAPVILSSTGALMSLGASGGPILNPGSMLGIPYIPSIGATGPNPILTVQCSLGYISLGSPNRFWLSMDNVGLFVFSGASFPAAGSVSSLCSFGIPPADPGWSPNNAFFVWKSIGLKQSEEKTPITLSQNNPYRPPPDTPISWGNTPYRQGITSDTTGEWIAIGISYPTSCLNPQTDSSTGFEVYRFNTNTATVITTSGTMWAIIKRTATVSHSDNIISLAFNDSPLGADKLVMCHNEPTTETMTVSLIKKTTTGSNINWTFHEDSQLSLDLDGIDDPNIRWFTGCYSKFVYDKRLPQQGSNPGLLFVGMYMKRINGFTQLGSVEVFLVTGTSIEHVQSIHPPQAYEHEYRLFGFSFDVVVSSDNCIQYVIIGMPTRFTESFSKYGDDFRGAVFIYKYDGVSFTYDSVINSPNPLKGSSDIWIYGFGKAVSFARSSQIWSVSATDEHHADSYLFMFGPNV